MFKSIIKFLLVLLLLSSAVSQPARAVQSPIDCNSNRLTLSITRDKLIIQQGDVLNYTITLSNVNNGGSIACDIENANVTVTLPALDGTPTGQVVSVVSGVNYPAGTSYSVVGTVPYTVNVNPGIVDAVAQVNVTGVLHDAPTDHSATISKTIGTTIEWPVVSTSSAVTASVVPLAAPAPLSSPTELIILPGMPDTASSS